MKTDSILSSVMVWVADRLSKSDHETLSMVGLSCSQITWLINYSLGDLHRLVNSGAVHLTISIDKEKVSDCGGEHKLHRQFLTAGASNDMMVYLFPTLKRSELRNMRQALNLPVSGGRPRQLEIHEIEEIIAVCKQLPSFETYRPESWLNLHKQLDSHFSFRDLWNTINDYQKR